MRVIAGEHKGRRLAPVPGQSTRPTTDKVKESIFNIIGPYFDGGTVLDLFAGTGALGIEALSRGADQAVFVDQDGKAISTVKQNVSACRLLDHATFLKQDAQKALSVLEKKGLPFRLVFLDPPYRMKIIPELLERLEKQSLLAPGALIVAEYDATYEIPLTIAGLECFRQVQYGETGVSFFQKGDEHSEQHRDISGEF